MDYEAQHCQKCVFLRYDEKASLPSRYIGEGRYVYVCKLYNVHWLSCYLDGAKGEGVFRCSECLENESKKVRTRRTKRK